MGLWNWILRLFGFGKKDTQKALQEKSILLLGLDNAGKTSLLHCLKTGEFAQFDRTLQANEDYFEIGNIKVHAFDLGGHKEVIQLWRDYFLQAEAIVFIIDASDQSRIEEAKNQLHSLIQDDTLKNLKFLILGNKSDIAGSYSIHELAHELKIPDESRFFLDIISVKQLYVSISGFNWVLSD